MNGSVLVEYSGDLFLPQHKFQFLSTGSWWAEWSPCCCGPPSRTYSRQESGALCKVSQQHVTCFYLQKWFTKFTVWGTHTHTPLFLPLPTAKCHFHPNCLGLNTGYVLKPTGFLRVIFTQTHKHKITHYSRFCLLGQVLRPTLAWFNPTVQFNQCLLI